MAARQLPVSTSRRWLVRLIGDAVIVIIIAIVTAQFRNIVTPMRQGFTCHDPRLQQPAKSETLVSNAVLYRVGFGLPAAIMILVECSLAYRSRQSKQQNLAITMIQKTFEAIMPFFFGGAVTHLSTNIPKYAIGRLRPNFFDVCRPDWLRIDCTNGEYVMDDICTNGDEDVDKSRVAFPSGHASLSMYFMLYLILYLQRRWTVTGLPLLRPVVQLVLFYMALYCGLTRLYDHLHHWEDIVAGDILGAAIAVIVALRVRPDYSSDAVDTTVESPATPDEHVVAEEVAAVNEPSCVEEDVKATQEAETKVDVEDDKKE